MKNVLLVFGGQSPEHEVSVISARNIYKAIDRNLFHPILCGVSKTGCFYEFTQVDLDVCKVVSDDGNSEKLASFMRFNDRTEFRVGNKAIKIDVVFCIIHGQCGEDGAMQGLFQIYNLPIVGCDLTSSAICMDKTLAKMIAEKHGIKTPKFLSFNKESVLSFEDCVNEIGYPFFLKIANLGSSIGVYKIKSQDDYSEALEKVWQFGKKVIVEEAIQDMKEVEVAILSDGSEVIASEVLGEIRHNNDKYDFYDYDAKYLDPNGAELIVPANIDDVLAKEIKKIAVEIFKACGCDGMARVDFFVSGDDIYFNEMNTLPGFANISMYPTLFQKSGLSYVELITRLIYSQLKNL
jgi:D-alanine-D-alanine ligase